MYADIQIGGIFVSSFVGYALGALVIVYLLRRLVFSHFKLDRYFANPPLAAVGFYVCVLALLIATT